MVEPVLVDMGSPRAVSVTTALSQALPRKALG
nr:MAG TPA: hypothetical protein [Caudoviricetes sp.]